MSGVAVAVRALCPGARVIGVEPELAADAQESLREGRMVSWPAAEVTRTICDGVRTQALGELTFATISALVDEIVTVPEDAVLEAMRWLALEAKLVVEPTGALTLAAVQTGAVAIDGPMVLVVSGGNVDAAVAAAVLEGRLALGPGKATDSRQRSGVARPEGRRGRRYPRASSAVRTKTAIPSRSAALVDVESRMVVRERGAELVVAGSDPEERVQVRRLA